VPKLNTEANFLGSDTDRGADAEFGLDELSAASGVAARTIRYYQTEGILTPPRRVGREARYRSAHLDELTQIGNLQARGLKIEAIKRVTGEGRRHRSLEELVGIEEVLNERWIDDEPTRYTLPELRGLLQRYPKRLIDELVEANLLVRNSDMTVVAPSSAMFDLAIRMIDAKVSIDVAVKATALLRRRLSKAADDLVELFATETGRNFAGSGTPEEIAAAIASVRPIALDGARVILAQEFHRALQQRKPRTALTRN
jgi:DNA-binding transcriptional MerR regulator